VLGRIMRDSVYTSHALGALLTRQFGERVREASTCTMHTSAVKSWGAGTVNCIYKLPVPTWTRLQRILGFVANADGRCGYCKDLETLV
jgi:hypothetical protein